MELKPVIKWAGGKRQLLPIINQSLPTQYNEYYEPFIGGAAVLLDLKPHDAHINDINPQLVNLYEQIKNSPKELIALVNSYDSVPSTKEYYLEMREKYNQKISTHSSDTETAAIMIWINKHCFNGLYRVNSQGLFNVPYNNKVGGSSIEEVNILGISKYLNESNVSITNLDFEDACKNVQPGDFVYFDSPYIPETTTANFTSYTENGFEYKDHLRLSELYKKLDKLGAKLMLSNNNVPLVYELYQGYNIKSFSASRMINRDANKRKGSEVLITNYEVKNEELQQLAFNF